MNKETLELVKKRDALLEDIFRCGIDGGELTSEAIERLEYFDKENKLPIKTLKNWSVVQLPTNPYEAPEMRVNRQALYGDWFFESRHRTGIITSQIKGAIGKYHVETISGSIYELEMVDPEWEKLYPDAANRFFKSAPQVTYVQ